MRNAAPLRIGYALSLTGPLASNAQSARLAHEIWREDVNRRGGLLGRPVEFVRYDDEADATKVPELYRHLLDVDAVDLVIGGYGTNSVEPAMPEIIKRRRYFVGLQGLGVNTVLGYPHYFAMIPTGPDPNTALTEGFFAVAAEQHPRPTTVALLSADALFSRNPIRGAKSNARKYSFEVVHEATYPLSTSDFGPVLDAVAHSRADLLFVCSYARDSINIMRALRAHTYRPKMVGAAMIGPQSSAVRTTLGPALNGVVNYEYWAPVPTMAFSGVQAFLDAYQARAVVERVDELGHYTAPLAYAQMQVVEQAIVASGGVADVPLSTYTRSAVFDTVMGPIRFGRDGEWAKPRVLQVQFQGITSHDIDPFRTGSAQVVVSPREFATGALRYPYAQAITN